MKNIITSDQLDHIHDTCNKYGIKKYKINPDGSIDVKGSVHLSKKNLMVLPLKFNYVTGDFNCDGNRLTSLEGCSRVGGNFYCRSNQLTSLNGSPISVGGDFYCTNNELTSLEGCTSSIGGDFFCGKNKLPSIVTSFCQGDKEPIDIFLKYQSHFDVWENGFNEEGFKELLAEIEDGLK